MNLIQFRKFRNSDKDEFVQMSKDFYVEDPPICEGMDMILTIQEYEKYPDKGSLFVLEYEGKVAGYAIINYFWSNELGGNILCLDELFVKSEFRNKGIGKSFINYMSESKVNNSKGIHLEMHPHNLEIKTYYEKLGFEVDDNTFMWKFHN